MCAHECPHFNVLRGCGLQNIKKIFSQHLCNPCNPDNNEKGTCIEVACIIFIHQNGSIARYSFTRTMRWRTYNHLIEIPICFLAIPSTPLPTLLLVTDEIQATVRLIHSTIDQDISRNVTQGRSSRIDSAIHLFSKCW